MQQLGVIGYGWLGKRIVAYFMSDYTVYTTTTTDSKLDILQENLYHPTLVTFPKDIRMEYSNEWDFSPKDCMIVTIPFITRRHSDEQMRIQAQNICNFIGDFKGFLFVMSTTSVYKNSEGVVKEQDVPNSSVAGEQVIREHYPQANILRLGGLMGDNRRLSHYAVKNTNDAVNHIHYKDVIGVIDTLLHQQITGKTYNVVTPHHPSKAEVIAMQKGLPFTQPQNAPTGKIVSSDLLLQDLSYQFLMPDVRLF